MKETVLGNVRRDVIKYVQLFEKRHPVPSYVKDSIYDIDETHTHILDFIKLEELAIAKFLRWRSQGVTSVYVYLSGLTTAAIAVLNAAFKTELYIKFYHYSFMQDEWLPQSIAYFNAAMPGNAPTTSEVELINKERSLRANLSDDQYAELISYMRIYKDVLQKVNQPGFDWELEMKNILHTYMSVDPKLISMMGGYLNKKTVGGRTYLGELRKRILAGKTKRGPARLISKGRTYHKKY